MQAIRNLMHGGVGGSATHKGTAAGGTAAHPDHINLSVQAIRLASDLPKDLNSKNFHPYISIWREGEKTALFKTRTIKTNVVGQPEIAFNEAHEVWGNAQEVLKCRLYDDNLIKDTIIAEGAFRMSEVLGGGVQSITLMPVADRFRAGSGGSLCNVLLQAQLVGGGAGGMAGTGVGTAAPVAGTTAAPGGMGMGTGAALGAGAVGAGALGAGVLGSQMGGPQAGSATYASTDPEGLGQGKAGQLGGRAVPAGLGGTQSIHRPGDRILDIMIQDLELSPQAWDMFHRHFGIEQAKLKPYVAVYNSGNTLLNKTESLKPGALAGNKLGFNNSIRVFANPAERISLVLFDDGFIKDRRIAHADVSVAELMGSPSIPLRVWHDPAAAGKHTGAKGGMAPSAGAGGMGATGMAPVAGTATGIDAAPGTTTGLTAGGVGCQCPGYGAPGTIGSGSGDIIGMLRLTCVEGGAMATVGGTGPMAGQPSLTTLTGMQSNLGPAGAAGMGGQLLQEQGLAPNPAQLSAGQVGLGPGAKVATAQPGTTAYSSAPSGVTGTGAGYGTSGMSGVSGTSGGYGSSSSMGTTAAMPTAGMGAGMGAPSSYGTSAGGLPATTAVGGGSGYSGGSTGMSGVDSSVYQSSSATSSGVQTFPLGAPAVVSSGGIGGMQTMGQPAGISGLTTTGVSQSASDTGGLSKPTTFSSTTVPQAQGLQTHRTGY